MNKPGKKSGVKSKAAGDNVALVENDLQSFSISHAISDIEQRVMDTDDQSTFRSEHDDVLPTPAGTIIVFSSGFSKKIQAKLNDSCTFREKRYDQWFLCFAAEMGSEAQIRFLKAKVRVMQEELDKLAHDVNKKVFPSFRFLLSMMCKPDLRVVTLHVSNGCARNLCRAVTVPIKVPPPPCDCCYDLLNFRQKPNCFVLEWTLIDLMDLLIEDGILSEGKEQLEILPQSTSLPLSPCTTGLG